MKNPGCANSRGSPLYISRNSSYQIPLSPNAPTAMIVKPKTACGDEDDLFSNLGPCSDFYVSKRVPTVGLGHVLGGGLLFLSVYLLHHIQVGMFGRLLLGAAPFAWIYGKEWLREHYYQFSGRVMQRMRVWESPLQALLTGVIAFISLISIGFVIYNLLHSFSWWFLPGTLVYVALLLGMPFIVWRYLRAPYEFVVGVALFALSAVLLSGGRLTSPLLFPWGCPVLLYPSGASGAMIVREFMAMAEVVALVMVLVGFVEHIEFLKLRRKMSALKEAA